MLKKDVRNCTASTVRPFEATWMDQSKIILSEVSQTKTNTKYHLNLESKI